MIDIHIQHLSLVLATSWHWPIGYTLLICRLIQCICILHQEHTFKKLTECSNLLKKINVVDSFHLRKQSSFAIPIVLAHDSTLLHHWFLYLQPSFGLNHQLLTAVAIILKDWGNWRLSHQVFIGMKQIMLPFVLRQCGCYERPSWVAASLWPSCGCIVKNWSWHWHSHHQGCDLPSVLDERQLPFCPIRCR